jgi:hypothetical protein
LRQPIVIAEPVRHENLSVREGENVVRRPARAPTRQDISNLASREERGNSYGRTGCGVVN